MDSHSPVPGAFAEFPMRLSVLSVLGGIMAAVWYMMEGGMRILPGYRYLEESRQVQVRVISSKFFNPAPPVHINRTDHEMRFTQLLGRDDHYAILLHGNHKVGKSDLVRTVLGTRGGVVHVVLDQPGKLAENAVISALGAKDSHELMSAMRAAARVLGRLPVLVLEIPQDIDDTQVVKSVSGFSKTWAFDQACAKVVVMASSASAALSFDPDGRINELFLPPLSKMDIEQLQVDDFLQHHGGKAAVEHTWDVYNLTGGNIGRMQDLAMQLKTAEWAAVREEVIFRQSMEVHDFFTIDHQGGFGPAKLKGARRLAKAVAEASFEAGVSGQTFEDFTAKDVALAVRARGVHPVYYNAQHGRYYAASPSVHALLKAACIS